ncbi:hypothetical protein [Herbaspirillum sp. alder98]|uniref:hypothetical protein n=1 Tax=Herbaspirillum sp. alder98 TaxID=2913096 RepID=UPI001CD8ADD5|nr:hypothetical protein [Herbaspirillum sp. alder98]
MSARKIRVVINNGAGKSSVHFLEPGADGGSLLVLDASAVRRGCVLLSEEGGLAPDEVVLSRSGDDLRVSFGGASLPQLAIQNFYRGDNLLGGLDQDGAYYGYVDGSAPRSSRAVH